MVITKYCEDCKREKNMKEGSEKHYGGYFLRKGEKIWLCEKHRPKHYKIMDEWTRKIIGEK